MRAKRHLEFFYFDAGGGHRSAANSLAAVIAKDYPDWHVDLVNLQELLKPIDPFHKTIHVSSEDIYNKMLTRGVTIGGNAALVGLQAGIRLYNKRIEAKLREHWQAGVPDMVVSLIPNFNAAMFRALRSVDERTPYVTIMTDIADCPPHFWQEKQEQFLICGSERAVQQAYKNGYRPDQIRQASGMILKPSFYDKTKVDQLAERQKLGLSPTKATAIIMFGGNGSSASLKIIARLRKAQLPVQSIVMCGHNEKLRETLTSEPNCHAVGFTNRVADYMALADFFIGKPGPGSISEALHMGLPVIVERSIRTMPQERPNTVWVRKNKLGLTVSSFREIAAAVTELLDGENLAQYRRNAKALNNQAVFEIPGMLAEIMEIQAQRIRPWMSHKNAEAIP